MFFQKQYTAYGFLFLYTGLLQRAVQHPHHHINLQAVQHSLLRLTHRFCQAHTQLAVNHQHPRHHINLLPHIRRAVHHSRRHLIHHFCQAHGHHIILPLDQARSQQVFLRYHRHRILLPDQAHTQLTSHHPHLHLILLPDRVQSRLVIHHPYHHISHHIDQAFSHHLGLARSLQVIHHSHHHIHLGRHYLPSLHSHHHIHLSRHFLPSLRLSRVLLLTIWRLLTADRYLQLSGST